MDFYYIQSISYNYSSGQIQIWELPIKSEHLGLRLTIFQFEYQKDSLLPFFGGAVGGGIFHSDFYRLFQIQSFYNLPNKFLSFNV